MMNSQTLIQNITINQLQVLYPIIKTSFHAKQNPDFQNEKLVYLFLKQVQTEYSLIEQYITDYLTRKNQKIELADEQVQQMNTYHKVHPKISAIIVQKYPQVIFSQKLKNNNANFWQLLNQSTGFLNQKFVNKQKQAIKFVCERMLASYLSTKTEQLERNCIFQFIKSLLLISTKQVHSTINQSYEEQILKLQLEQIEGQSVMKLVQLFHNQIPYNFKGKLQTSKNFKKSLHLCMMDFESKMSNSLAANIYGQLMQRSGKFNQDVQNFINIYQTLSSFGNHLVKDIWPDFYALCNSLETFPQSIFTLQELLTVILYKVLAHRNQNVVRFCIQQIFSYQKPQVFFETDIVYSAFMKVINDGMLYQDQPVYRQSKSYDLIQNFFCRFYNNVKNNSVLSHHLVSLFDAIFNSNLVTFEVGSIALIGVFSRVQIASQIIEHLKFVDKERLLQISKLALKRHYSSMPISKKIVLIKYLCSMLQKFLSKNVSINDFVQNWIKHIPDDFITKIINEIQYDGLKKLCLKMFQQKDLRNNILENVSNRDYLKLGCIIQFSPLQDEEWQNCFAKNVKNFGISLYKTQTARNQILKQISDVILFSNSQNRMKIFALYQHILNNIVALLNSVIQNKQKKGTDQPLASLQQDSILYIIEYYTSTIITSESQSAQRQFLAKFTEWLVDHLESNSFVVKLLICTINSRVQALYENKLKSGLVQQSFYTLNQKVYTLNIKAVDKLKIRVLTTFLLLDDLQWALGKMKNLKQQLLDATDQYDFQHYDQILLYTAKLYTTSFRINQIKLQRVENTEMNQQESVCLNKALLNILDNLIDSLGYSIQPIHVKAYMSCLFDVPYVHNRAYVKNCVIPISQKLIKIGSEYYMFHRCFTNEFMKVFNNQSNRLAILKNPQWIQLINQMILIEQYRGDQSAIVCNLFKSQSKSIVSLNPKMNQQGTYIRFKIIQWIQISLKVILQQDNQNQNSNIQISFFIQLFNSIIRPCLEPVLKKEKMFLTGNHKVRIKSWQCLLVFSNFVLKYHQNVQKLLFSILLTLQQNHLTEVRFYSQMFILRLLLDDSQKLYNAEAVCNFLKDKIKDSMNNLTKSVTYLIFSGLVLQKGSNQSIFHTILCFVCSHISYYRGLSQYFCFERSYPFQITIIVQTIKTQYQKDSDAKNVTKKIKQIIEKYKNRIKEWSPSTDLFTKSPNVNHQITQPHYIEQFRRFGQTLVKVKQTEGIQEMHQQGYFPAKQLWKRANLGTCKNKENFNKQSANDVKAIFQKKIDPSLDDLVLNRKLGSQVDRGKLKVLVVSYQNIPILGHISRTGQILGLSQLIVQNQQVKQSDDFRSVSCTSQKWLKISSWRNRDYLNKIVLDLVREGYQILRIVKCKKALIPKLSQASQFLSNKCLIILDQLDKFQSLEIEKQMTIKPWFSTHVQIAILIWQFLAKFNLNQ